MSTTQDAGSKLAIHGGPKAVENLDGGLFHWPIVTEEDEKAVIDVLRKGSMSGVDVTQQFEAEWAEYLGTKYALANCNGTSALLEAMFAVGIGRRDEMIVPSMTYWASALQVMSLGGTPVFADCHPDSLCIDPADIEKRIGKRTKAIMVVHYCGHPADMDPIMAIAEKHNLKVIEDVSHAHGALYKGRKVGTFGDVSAMSMMSGKGFAVGEGGILCTDDDEIFQRAIAFGHYERQASDITIPEIKAITFPDHVRTGMPLGAIKGRLNQTCAAFGRVQLKHYPDRLAEIQKAMNYFCDLLEELPGLKAHRPADSKSHNGCWYNPLIHYVPEEVGNVPVEKVYEALTAEGFPVARGANYPIHLHPVVNEADIYHDGKPTAIAFADRDTRLGKGSLPVSEATYERTLGIGWFKKYDPKAIETCAAAAKKVFSQIDQLA